MNMHIIEKTIGLMPTKAVAIRIGILYGLIAFIVFESGYFDGQIPQIPIVWQLLFLAPSLLFYLTVPALMVIGHPRKTSILFIAGASFEKRKTVVLQFIRSVTNHLLLFSAISLLVAAILELAFRKFSLLIWLVPIGAIVFLLVWFTGMVVLPSFVKHILKPSHKDETVVSGPMVFSTFIHTSHLYVTRMLVSLLIIPLPHPLRSIARHQLFYLLRLNLIAFTLMPLFGIVVITLLMVLLPDTNPRFFDILLVLTPYFVILMNHEGMYESMKSITTCAYYEFRSKDILIAHMYILNLLLIPYLLMFLIKLAGQGLTFEDLGRLVNYSVSYCYLLFISGIWYTKLTNAHNKVINVLIQGFIIVILPGIFIPVYGAFFPMTLLLFVSLLEKGIIFKGDNLQATE